MSFDHYPAPHRPAKRSNYANAHAQHMAELRSRGVVQAENLVMRPADDAPDELLTIGEIACLGQLLVAVEKTHLILEPGMPNPLMVTVDYSYNLSVQGHGTVFRYDNAHPWPRHADDHHRHSYDWRTDKQDEDSPVWIGLANWPLFSDVLHEVENWYWEHREELPEPDSVAQLGAGRVPTLD